MLALSNFPLIFVAHIFKVVVTAHAHRVGIAVPISVLTRSGQLLAPKLVVAFLTEALGVIFAICVGAFVDGHDRHIWLFLRILRAIFIL